MKFNKHKIELLRRLGKKRRKKPEPEKKATNIELVKEESKIEHIESEQQCIGNLEKGDIIKTSKDVTGQIRKIKDGRVYLLVKMLGRNRIIDCFPNMKVKKIGHKKVINENKYFKTLRKVYVLKKDQLEKLQQVESK